MIWRESYRTAIAHEVPLPELPAEMAADVILGGFDFGAISQMGVWERLLQADAPEARWVQVFFLGEPGPDDTNLMESIVPPSRIDQAFLIYDDSMAWRELIQPDGPQQAFAAVVSHGRGRVVMKGLPTEEAWDSFLAELT